MRTLVIAAALAACSISFGQSMATYSTFSGPVGQFNISLAGGVGVAYGPDIVYSNSNDVGYYMPGHDMGDELLLTRGGVVNGFNFGYYDPAGGNALHTIDVWFHDMTNGNYITGYTISGLPGDGAWVISIDLSGGFEFVAPSDILMSLGFQNSDSPEAGWLLADPPAVGASSDDFYSWTDSTWYWFGGNPVANFHAEIAMTPEPGTIAAVGAGLVGLLGLRRRK